MYSSNEKGLNGIRTPTSAMSVQRSVKGSIKGSIKGLMIVKGSIISP